MKETNQARLKDIFDAAVAVPADERSRLLDAACATDHELRDRLEQLLAADDAAGGFLETSPFAYPADNIHRGARFVGQTIGAYYIERIIGSGGMGTVFLANRDLGGIVQTVALKIVHDEGNSVEIARRFIIERQILAGLEHSGIARLIDAGRTNDGLPFLVMEYIDGIGFDDHCAAGNLAVSERLMLFQKVCSAVSYAHRRLVIHRDLKPSNILVTTEGEPKLLDFGIAKLLAPADADATQTATLMNLLTPAYAAPEQLRGETITTATDVYSLGVILYETLAGIRPFSFNDKNYQDIVRIICETDPPKPSEAITLRNNGLQTADPAKPDYASISKFRAGVNRTLRGDLDNIVLKALRKDPDRRYQSVDQFSEDIERYLKGLPVSARPDTFSYRAGKFFERNRKAAIAVSAVLLLLVASVVGTTWQAIRAAREKEVAERRFAQVRELAGNVIFKYHDAIANLNGSTEARKMLVNDATKYLDNLTQDADADDDLRNELALAYAKLADVQGKPFAANTGDTAGARANYDKSIKLLEDLARSDDRRIAARAGEELITTYHGFSALASRMLHFDDSVDAQQKALVLAQKHLDLDPGDLKRRLTFARANLWLGDAYAEAGNFEAAMNSYQLLISLAEDIYAIAPNDPDAKTVLGVAHDRTGRNFLLRALELERTDLPRESETAIFRDSYDHLAKTLALFNQVANNNPGNQKFRRNVYVAESNLGMALRSIGENADSLKILEKVAAERARDQKDDVGNDDLTADHAEDLHQLALTLSYGHQTKEALKELGSAIEIIDGLIAKDAVNMGLRRIQLAMISDDGRLLAESGDIPGALALYQTSLNQASLPKTFSDETFADYAIGSLNENIGDCYARLALKLPSATIDRRRTIERSENHFRIAADHLDRPDVKRVYFSRTPELLDYLQRKLKGLNDSR